MPGRATPVIIASLLIGLAGCNASAPPPAVTASQVVASPAAASIDVPAGSACAADIQRWHALISSDEQTGNANETVYRQVEREIADAAAACRAGHDAEARAMIRASRARHGYPGG